MFPPNIHDISLQRTSRRSIVIEAPAVAFEVSRESIDFKGFCEKETPLQEGFERRAIECVAGACCEFGHDDLVWWDHSARINIDCIETSRECHLSRENILYLYALDES